jgi:hypothetical protein
LECVFDEEEDVVPIDQEPVKLEEEEEEEEEGSQDGQAQISGYSQVEPDLEDMDDEEEQPQQEVGTVDQPTAEPNEDLVDSPQSSQTEENAIPSSPEDDGSCVEIDSNDDKDEQEEEQGDEEEEDFELHLAETPKPNVTRHSSHRRRFSMSSVASSESSQDEDQVIREEEESEHENQVIREAEESVLLRGNQVVEPEMSPTSDSQSGQLSPEDVAEQERQCRQRIQRSSVFKV